MITTRALIGAIGVICLVITGGDITTCHASLAENIVHPPAGSSRDEEISKIDSQWETLVTYAALGIPVMSRQQAQAETARTDKQPGAVPSTSGTTSLVAKPGLTELLALAIEQGAVEKESNATSVTLRTSPYLLLTGFGVNDTAESYQRYSFWRMFEFHVSYPVSSNEKNNEAKEVVDWGTRIRLYGDRSPRSERFITLWNQRVRPLVLEHAKTLTRALSTWLNGNAEVRRRNDEERQQATDQITSYLASTRDTDAVQVQKVEQIIDEGVERVALQVKPLPEEFARKIPELTTMQEGGRARQELLAVMDEVARSPLLTLEYIDQRNEKSSDVSLLLLEYENRVEPLDLIINAKSSFYNDPHLAGTSSSVKEYGATIALEWRGNNFLFKPSDDVDMSQLTVAGCGAVSHVEGISGIRGSAQLRLEIPIRKGVTLPLALSYATRTDTSTRSEIRGNFGLTFDWTKLLATASRYAQPAGSLP